MSNKILVALSTFAEFDSTPLELLKQSGLPYLLNTLKRRLTREELVKLGADCAGVIAGVEPYDTFVLENLPYLRCISRCGVGMDNVDVDATEKRQIRILTTPDVVIEPVAELTIGMIFDLLRKLSFHTALLRRGKWEKHAGGLLRGRSVGILGLGRIGKRVAESLVKLGAVVYGADLRPDAEWASQVGVKIATNSELVCSSDILSLHLSVLKEQPFRLDGEAIRSMKRGALLVNVSRGDFIDEMALYWALREGYLGGAALDVFSEEPYTGKLCELNNVVLTPHLGTLTLESRAQMETEATRNLLAYLAPTST